MPHKDKNDSEYYESMEEAKKEGYFPVKVKSLLEFYTLKGRTSILSRANIEPIRYLYYVVCSSSDGRYYKRLFRSYPLDELYFYRKSLTFSGNDEAIENLQKYVADNTVTLLFTKQQVDNTTDVLTRLWKANMSGEGKLSYRIYLQILDISLKLEDYKDYGKNLTGFKTACNQLQLKINELWKQASEIR